MDYLAGNVQLVIAIFVENIDKKKTNNVIFFVSIVDSDNAEIMENYSAEQLNSYDKFLTFKNRFQSKP